MRIGERERGDATGCRVGLLALILGALTLRLWALDSQGLAYDEAATALMARATPLAIIEFHWRAAYEHPPIWQLLMRFWSLLAGQSELALRFLPVLAGVAQAPLVWQLARRVRRNEFDIAPRSQGDPFALPWLAALLVTVMPVLVYYSQEARMYSLVVALALAVLWSFERLSAAPTPARSLIFASLVWLMSGLHYYSILLVLAIAWYALWVLRVRRAPSGHWSMVLFALGLAVAPLALWLLLAPGFHATLRSIVSDASAGQPGVWPFLDRLWRELSFGAIRWPPAYDWIGYLLLPLALIGFVRLTAHSRRWLRSTSDGRNQAATAYSLALLLLLVLLVPLLVSALWFRTLATRYLLYLAPLLCLLVAAGVDWLAHVDRRLAGLWLGVTLMVCAGGLFYYFGDYQKSYYREMAHTLNTQVAPDDGVLLEAPRQHLLAKYYLPARQTYYTAPHVELPDVWPINAPPLVPEEMDDRIQEYLRRHAVLWLILTAEDEVDKGEFISKYLTAVSYRQRCQEWLDVRLCRFVSPQHVQLAVQTRIEQRFGPAFWLQGAAMILDETVDGSRFLLVELGWFAEQRPEIDYRVTLRLLDADGVTVSQQDEYPIGPLLPPSTWQAGDAKPGYMVLALPADLDTGRYAIVVGLYDPASLELLAHSDQEGSSSTEWIHLGVLGASGGELHLRSAPEISHLRN
jgi:mannosyltransferase